MRCEQVRDLLSPYMDGMTNERENNLIEEHFKSCTSCRKELEKMQFIAACLNSMEVPPCPEGLASDVRKRILEEKNKVFSLREAAKPKRQGWLAAGIAGIALLVGIYINSILPVENIAFLRPDKESEGNKNVAVIEEKGTLSRIIGMTGLSKESRNKVAVSEADKGQPADENAAGDKTANTAVTLDNNIGKNKLNSSDFAEQMAARVKVEDIDKAAQEVIKLAEASQATYRIEDAMQPLAGGTSKCIELSVEKEKAEVIMEQLSLIGEVSSTSRSQVELTEQYNKIQQEINMVKQEIAQAEKEGNTAAKSELEKREQELNRMKTALDEQKDRITLKIYIVEDIKP